MSKGNEHVKYSRSPGIKLKDLNILFDLNDTILLDGNLYERLYTDPSCLGHSVRPKHKYRRILNVDDYDYVTDPALQKKLNRAFAK